MCRIIHKPWSAKYPLLDRNCSHPLFQNTLSSHEIARAHYISKHALLARNRSLPLFGRSKVTLLSPTLSTQTQAEKPKGRGRSVNPPHTFQTNASIRHGSPSQFPIHTSWVPNHLLRGSSLLPSRETSAPPPWRPHRTKFTAALLPNAGDAVHLPSYTRPCASYSVLPELPRRRPLEP